MKLSILTKFVRLSFVFHDCYRTRKENKDIQFIILPIGKNQTLEIIRCDKKSIFIYLINKFVQLHRYTGNDFVCNIKFI